MRFSFLAVWGGIALAVFVVLVLLTNMPGWAAGLIAVFAVMVNILVGRVEDGNGRNPLPFRDLPLGRRVLRVALRVAGALIGVGTIAIGLITLGDPPPPANWWRRYGIPVGIIVSGSYFLMYGLTGRSRIMTRRRDGQ